MKPSSENHYASFGTADHPYVGMVHYVPEYDQYKVSLWRMGACLDTIFVDEYLSAMILAASAVYCDNPEEYFDPEFAERMR